MEDSKKYTIDEKLTELKKDTVVAKRELRKLLGVKHSRFNDIVSAKIESNINANGHQLGIIAKYLKCSVSSLYTGAYFQSIPTLTKIKQEAKAAA